MKRRQSPLRRLKHFFVAHRGNGYRPGIFAKEVAGGLILLLLIIEGLYLIQVHVVLKQEGFLATVLPAALTTLANNDRASNDLAPLTEDPALDAIAQAKADDMAAKGYFAHVSPEGKTPWYWLQQAGYPYTYAGENLAVDFTDSADVENAWMNSPMHRANLLKGEYTHVGIGIAEGTYEGKEVTFVAQFFATRKDDPAPVKPKPTTTVTPAATVATIPATVPAETQNDAEPAVLGAQTPPDEVQETEVNETAVAMTSPTRILWYVFAAFAALFAILFIGTLVTHAKRRLVYFEVLGSGFLLTGVAAMLLLFGGVSRNVSLPQDSQSASVIRAL